MSLLQLFIFTETDDMMIKELSCDAGMGMFRASFCLLIMSV